MNTRMASALSVAAPRGQHAPRAVADAMRVFLATVLRHLVLTGVTHSAGHSIQLSHTLFHSIQAPCVITESIKFKTSIRTPF